MSIIEARAADMCLFIPKLVDLLFISHFAKTKYWKPNTDAETIADFFFCLISHLSVL